MMGDPDADTDTDASTDIDTHRHNMVTKEREREGSWGLRESNREHVGILGRVKVVENDVSTLCGTCT
jgi:hypothetical protein